MAPGRGDEDASKADERKTSSPLPFVLAVVLAGFIIVDKSELFAQAEVVDQLEPYRSHEIDSIAAGQRPHSHSSYESSVATAEIQAKQVPERMPSFFTFGSAASASSPNRSTPTRRTSSAVGAQHNALLFLFNGIMVGTVITHLKTRFHGLPETVCIFTMGAIYSVCFEGFHLNDNLGVLGDSYNMWMSIDPHLLIFVMLPPLLAGDAMAIDTAIARKVSKQWMYLAGPGVLINGFLTAIFLWLYLPYDWPFLLCLTTGAILCATDPVAVVALLKELGAPPALTVQIQGESLLNDGTAIVLYQLSYNMLAGKTYEVSDVIVFLVKTAACAWGLGLAIGYLFYLWICTASNKLEGHNIIIQISLTVCCAYWSFIIAEGVFHISGVLATVGSSLVLADKMWPVIVCKESMHTVWHMFEYLGNVIVFFLAGALTAKVMVTMAFRDFLDLFVIYLVLIFIRGSMLLASRPIMNYFGSKVSPPQIVSVADLLVMTWGGLRGAVGLALAIQVTIDRAGGKISKKNADRVLFYVSGVAALTLLVNATTAPALVKLLGITQMPETKKRVLIMLQERLAETLQRRKGRGQKVQKDKDDTGADLGDEAVRKVETALNKMEQWIERQSARHSVESENRNTRNGWGSISDSASRGVSFFSRNPVTKVRDTVVRASRRVSVAAVKNFKRLTQRRMTDLKNCQEILLVLTEVREKFRKVDAAHVKLLGELPEMPSAEQEQEVIKVVSNDDGIDSAMVRTIHEVFLNLMYSNYWHLIDAGEVVPGTNEAEVVLTSVKLALSSTKLTLSDFENIRVCIFERVQHKERGFVDNMKAKLETYSTQDNQTVLSRATRFSVSATKTFANPTFAGKEKFNRLVDSTWFNALCLILIVSNAIFIALEDNYQNENNKADLAWLIADMSFTVFFFLEFVFKFLSLHCAYFKDWWNVMDFLLVIMSIASVILHFMAKDLALGQTANVSSEGRLVRLARVLRVMRLMRLFRVLGFLRLLKAKLMPHVEFSKHVAEQMQTLTILTCFIKAHLMSQKQIISYFGYGQTVDMPEIARCLLESQVETYRALSLAVDCVQQLDEGMLLEVNSQKKAKALAEELEHLVQHAHLHHVLSSTEAESVLDPVREQLRLMQSRIWDMHFGYIRGQSTRSEKQACDGAAEEEDCIAPNAAENPQDSETKQRMLDSLNLRRGMTDAIWQDILPDGRISYRSSDVDDASLLSPSGICSDRFSDYGATSSTLPAVRETVRESARDDDCVMPVDEPSDFASGRLSNGKSNRVSAPTGSDAQSARSTQFVEPEEDPPTLRMPSPGSLSGGSQPIKLPAVRHSLAEPPPLSNDSFKPPGVGWPSPKTTQTMPPSLLQSSSESIPLSARLSDMSMDPHLSSTATPNTRQTRCSLLSLDPEFMTSEGSNSVSLALSDISKAAGSRRRRHMF